MLKTRYITSVILTLFLLSLATEQSLKAYADPGSGAMFVQIILAGIIGISFRIRSLIKRFRRSKSEDSAFPALVGTDLTQSTK